MVDKCIVSGGLIVVDPPIVGKETLFLYLLTWPSCFSRSLADSMSGRFYSSSLNLCF